MSLRGGVRCIYIPMYFLSCIGCFMHIYSTISAPLWHCNRVELLIPNTFNFFLSTKHTWKGTGKLNSGENLSTPHFPFSSYTLAQVKISPHSIFQSCDFFFIPKQNRFKLKKNQVWNFSTIPVFSNILVIIIRFCQSILFTLRLCLFILLPKRPFAAQPISVKMLYPLSLSQGW